MLVQHENFDFVFEMVSESQEISKNVMGRKLLILILFPLLTSCVNTYNVVSCSRLEESMKNSVSLMESNGYTLDSVANYVDDSKYSRYHRNSVDSLFYITKYFLHKGDSCVSYGIKTNQSYTIDDGAGLCYIKGVQIIDTKGLSPDIIDQISSCILNLEPQKERVLSEGGMVGIIYGIPLALLMLFFAILYVE